MVIYVLYYVVLFLIMCLKELIIVFFVYWLVLYLISSMGFDYKIRNRIYVIRNIRLFLM